MAIPHVISGEIPAVVVYDDETDDPETREVAVPSGLSAGDWIIAFYSGDNYLDASLPVMGLDWTPVYGPVRVIDGTFKHYIGVVAREVTGLETSPVTFGGVKNVVLVGVTLGDYVDRFDEWHAGGGFDSGADVALILEPDGPPYVSAGVGPGAFGGSENPGDMAFVLYAYEGAVFAAPGGSDPIPYYYDSGSFSAGHYPATAGEVTERYTTSEVAYAEEGDWLLEVRRLEAWDATTPPPFDDVYYPGALYDFDGNPYVGDRTALISPAAIMVYPGFLGESEPPPPDFEDVTHPRLVQRRVTAKQLPYLLDTGLLNRGP